MLKDNKNWLKSAFIRRRRWEYDLIASAIMDVQQFGERGKRRVIEVGCGLGIGAASLCRIGDLIITDVYKHELLDLPVNVKFRLADIYQMDFQDDEFDIVVSNQVLPCLENLEKAFCEMKRIAKQNAYFVFGVPTSTWLILSIPGQIYKKVENIYKRIKSKVREGKRQLSEDQGPILAGKTHPPKGKGSYRLGLGGLWHYQSFCATLRAMRVKNWRKILLSNDFEIIREAPLLSYGSSRLPIIPTNRILAKLGLCASYLFICQSSKRIGL